MFFSSYQISRWTSSCPTISIELFILFLRIMNCSTSLSPAESTMTWITFSNWWLFTSFFPHSATYPSFCSLYSISLDYIWSNSPSYSSPKRLVCPAQCIIAVLSYILVWNLLFLPPFSQLTKCVIWEILYFCLWDVSWFLPWIAPYSSSLAPCA